MTEWVLIAHGGARRLEPEEEPACRRGMAAALLFGVRVLSSGGSALDAVEAVVRALEDDATFNAGNGSVRNASGGVQMDASIMDGASLEIGAVVGLKTAGNPVSVARRLLKEKEILLAGEGAEAFVRHGEQGVLAEHSAAAGAGCDTVGCVALDSHGDLAVATSTGGLSGSLVGRVGDVALPGCGFYADNARGAVSLSGDGEAIARLMLAGEFLRALGDGTPEAVACSTVDRTVRLHAEAGLIAITPEGQVCWSHNSPHFTVGVVRQQAPDPEVRLRKDRPT
jgi:beta-aspartyl-peptidase (threonine type)